MWMRENKLHETNSVQLWSSCELNRNNLKTKWRYDIKYSQLALPRLLLSRFSVTSTTLVKSQTWFFFIYYKKCLYRSVYLNKFVMSTRNSKYQANGLLYLISQFISTVVTLWIWFRNTANHNFQDNIYLCLVLHVTV